MKNCEYQVKTVYKLKAENVILSELGNYKVGMTVPEKYVSCLANPEQYLLKIEQPIGLPFGIGDIIEINTSNVYPREHRIRSSKYPTMYIKLKRFAGDSFYGTVYNTPVEVYYPLAQVDVKVPVKHILGKASPYIYFNSHGQRQYTFEGRDERGDSWRRATGNFFIDEQKAGEYYNHYMSIINNEN